MKFNELFNFMERRKRISRHKYKIKSDRMGWPGPASITFLCSRRGNTGRSELKSDCLPCARRCGLTLEDKSPRCAILERLLAGNDCGRDNRCRCHAQSWRLTSEGHERTLCFDIRWRASLRHSQDWRLTTEDCLTPKTTATHHFMHKRTEKKLFGTIVSTIEHKIVLQQKIC